MGLSSRRVSPSTCRLMTQFFSSDCLFVCFLLYYWSTSFYSSWCFLGPTADVQPDKGPGLRTFVRLAPPPAPPGLAEGAAPQLFELQEPNMIDRNSMVWAELRFQMVQRELARITSAFVCLKKRKERKLSASAHLKWTGHVTMKKCFHDPNTFARVQYVKTILQNWFKL